VPRPGVVDVSGRVIDFHTNQGVPNAVVVLSDVGPVPGSGGHEATTDASGLYRLTVPTGGYFAYVDGHSWAWFNLRAPAYRGDLLVNPAGCAARYGVVLDARTGQPVAGVRVLLVGFETVTDSTGWYRLDIGCQSDYGVGTTFVHFSRSGYQDRSLVAGRRESLAGVWRMDAALAPEGAAGRK
jgi:hypothetical protein